MFRFMILMLIPLWVLIYTIQFGRWVWKKQNRSGTFAIYFIGIGAFMTAGWILWRMSHA
ncbi:hypothetical protein JZ785_15110 [Alicyclobacillus curvatus]|nr:hypothetical protein JZ785_15110 [Alicyclobacillus curvatus]